jgi:hypothetical protein
MFITREADDKLGGGWPLMLRRRSSSTWQSSDHIMKNIQPVRRGSSAIFQSSNIVKNIQAAVMHGQVHSSILANVEKEDALTEWVAAVMRLAEGAHGELQPTSTYCAVSEGDHRLQYVTKTDDDDDVDGQTEDHAKDDTAHAGLAADTANYDYSTSDHHAVRYNINNVSSWPRNSQERVVMRGKPHEYLVLRLSKSTYTSSTSLDSCIPVFEYAELAKATNNFSPGKLNQTGGIYIYICVHNTSCYLCI